MGMKLKPSVTSMVPKSAPSVDCWDDTGNSKYVASASHIAVQKNRIPY